MTASALNGAIRLALLAAEVTVSLNPFFPVARRPEK
jgi:hypothetical protein